MKRILVAMLLFVGLVSTADARSRHIRVASTGLHPMCNITMPCEVTSHPVARVRVAQSRRYVRYATRQAAPERRRYRSLPAPDVRNYAYSGGYTGGGLMAKVSQIQASCGSKVISHVRPGARIAGTGHMSLHASGKAVDMAGNPSCIYAHLQGWPGGYSTDYGRMQHVHISYDPQGGREMGLHFRHGGGGYHRHRYAHRRHHYRRYAQR